MHLSKPKKEAEPSSPARHLYQITPEGDEYLSWWVEDLPETDQVLHFCLETAAWASR